MTAGHRAVAGSHIGLSADPVLARALAASRCATAMMGLSDGLASDLRYLTARSGARARLRRTALPISEAARVAGAALGTDPAEWALCGEEDYELLFSLPPSTVEQACE